METPNPEGLELEDNDVQQLKAALEAAKPEIDAAIAEVQNDMPEIPGMDKMAA